MGTNKMKTVLKHLSEMILIVACLGKSDTLHAQNTPVPKQVWPEVDAYYRFSEKFRMYGLISGTRADDEYTDGTAGVYLDYFALPWFRQTRNETEMSDSTRGYYLWFRSGYSYSAAPTYEKKNDVSTWEMESNSYFHLPLRSVIIWRNRIDWSWQNGAFRPDYRLRLKLVKNLKTRYLTFNGYTYGEYFYYWNENGKYKFRWCIGSVIKVSKALEFELYYLYQFPNRNSVSSVNAIGLQFNLYFSSKKIAG
jgi:hypothetical protein